MHSFIKSTIANMPYLSSYLKKLTVLFFLILMVFDLSMCATNKRYNVNIEGGTPLPPFVRNEGELAAMCPESHKYNYADFSRCCQEMDRHDVNCNGDPNDNDLTLKEWDPEACCQDGKWVPCPVEGKKCKRYHAEDA